MSIQSIAYVSPNAFDFKKSLSTTFFSFEDFIIKEGYLLYSWW